MRAKAKIFTAAVMKLRRTGQFIAAGVPKLKCGPGRSAPERVVKSTARCILERARAERRRIMGCACEGEKGEKEKKSGDGNPGSSTDDKGR